MSGPYAKELSFESLSTEVMPLGVFSRVGDLLRILKGVRNLPELDTPEGAQGGV